MKQKRKAVAAATALHEGDIARDFIGHYYHSVNKCIDNERVLFDYKSGLFRIVPSRFCATRMQTREEAMFGGR
jgi:hypothetical protein